MDDAFKIISRNSSFGSLSPPNERKLTSSKWQSENLALKMSHVKGSRYLMIDGESKPIYILDLH